MKNAHKSRFGAKRLLASTCCTTAIILFGGAPALAQVVETTQATVEPVTERDVVIITGSRIERDPNLASPVPVQSVTAEEISLAPTTNVADIVNDVPALIGSVTGESSLQTGFADGTNVLNLRNLGTARTLTLVNGRRHVSGVEGSSAVDVGSIPKGLLERVEVLTGGASAIYGSDAVTGVVNFITKRDFEGFEVDLFNGISGEGDGAQLGFSALWGANLNDGAGNLAIAFEYNKDSGLLAGDREFLANNRLSDDRPNPALRFQRGDINPATMPNLAQFYDFDTTGRYPYGLSIPLQAAFINSYTNTFGSAPTLTQAEIDLLGRRIGAPTRLIAPYPVFTVSSAGGVIAPGDFSFASGTDVNNNGIDDCLESFVGYNSSFDGTSSFGAAGGCWVIDPDGTVRPIQDGLITGSFDGFGGDSIGQNFNEDTVIPENKRMSLNVLFNHDLTDTLAVFLEAKHVRDEVLVAAPYNTFYDLLTVAPDNPFIPAALQQVATDTGGLWITRDMIDLGPSIDVNDRRTSRLVAGLRGTIFDDYSWELAANYGKFERIRTDNNRVIIDRFLSGIDVTTDGSGNPICRADLDGSPPPGNLFDFPFAWDGGFYTFTPGTGSCVPVNIMAGRGNISQEAIDWVTTTVVNKDEISQLVLTADLAGDTGRFFSLPGGPIGFAIGAEYREETSKVTFDPLVLGIIPEGSPFPAGTNIADVSTLGDPSKSLVFDPAIGVLNATGSYDVTDLYAEVSLPLLSNVFLAQELTLDGAFRYADYSTVGAAETWKVGLVYTPFQDLTFRVTQSEAIRAPNITELFAPAQGTTFRPVEPCGQAEIDSLNASNPTAGAIREANCRQDGLPVGWEESASGRFGGTVGGNPNLREEKAETFTAGVVIQPRFLPGFSLSADYWDIRIIDGIANVAAQDIVDNCYDSTTFPNDYCGLFQRNRDTTSPAYGNIVFLSQSRVNFGTLEASGIDVAAGYTFSLGDNTFGIRAQASQQEKLDLYFDPSDPTVVDPELGELQVPEWAGSLTLSWRNGPIYLALKTQYVGEQLLRGAEIETYETIFGDAAWADEMYIMDLTGQFNVNDKLSFYGGVSNITDEVPYVTEQAYPVSPRGRFFYAGVKASF